MNPGSDGDYYTGDDSVTTFIPDSTGDTEDVAYDSMHNDVFVADGLAEEVFKIDPGPDGVFGAGGDDTVTQFDVGSMGVCDPEGIEFNPDNGHMYILSRTNDLIAETLTDGTLIRYYDYSTTPIDRGADLAFAPSSINPAETHLYIVQRGVDEGTDGIMYEVALEASTLSSLNVDAGPDQNVTLPNSVTLNGIVNYDGLPDLPETVTTTWTKTNGPGIVTFANDAAVATMASFSQYGLYELTLTAYDGTTSVSDTVTITVLGLSGQFPHKIPINDKSDDAEEGTSGGSEALSNQVGKVSFPMLIGN